MRVKYFAFDCLSSMQLRVFETKKIIRVIKILFLNLNTVVKSEIQESKPKMKAALM